MAKPALLNTLRDRRERLGLSQQALATRVGITRQAVIAIEAGRQVPSTPVALHLARTLGCGVEDLFTLGLPDVIEARRPGRRRSTPSLDPRVVVGRVGNHFVAHPLEGDPSRAADGLELGRPAADTCAVQPLVDAQALEQNVLVAGCAPLLGPLLSRLGARYRDAHGTWVRGNSQRALQLLKAGLVHVAGLHLFDAPSGEHNLPFVRRQISRRVHVFNLTRWQQGLVVARGNPMGIRAIDDLLRSDVRAARREPGSGAARLVERLLGRSAPRLAPGRLATGHEQVARLVELGVVDVGVAIEAVAVAADLEFIPLAEENFDLVVPADVATTKPVGRLIDALDDPAFRAEVEAVAGYDTSHCGDVTTLDAA